MSQERARDFQDLILSIYTSSQERSKRRLHMFVALMRWTTALELCSRRVKTSPLNQFIFSFQALFLRTMIRYTKLLGKLKVCMEMVQMQLACAASRQGGEGSAQVKDRRTHACDGSFTRRKQNHPRRFVPEDEDGDVRYEQIYCVCQLQPIPW